MSGNIFDFHILREMNDATGICLVGGRGSHKTSWNAQDSFAQKELASPKVKSARLRKPVDTAYREQC